MINDLKNLSLMMSNKNWRKYQCQKDGVSYLIEEDLVGWYLIVYQNNRSSQDCLLDTLEDAFLKAEQKFAIPRILWHEAP